MTIPARGSARMWTGFNFQRKIPNSREKAYHSAAIDAGQTLALIVCPVCGARRRRAIAQFVAMNAFTTAFYGFMIGLVWLNFYLLALPWWTVFGLVAVVAWNGTKDGRRHWALAKRARLVSLVKGERREPLPRAVLLDDGRERSKD